MGCKEVLKILDEAATKLVKKAETLDIEDSLDYMMASSLIMNEYVILSLKMGKVKENEANLK